MTDKKELRLSKLAREFNVGITTIVDFLKKKGFEIESNPNTKVAPELLEILSKEYSSDVNAKKESEKVNFASFREKKDVITIDEREEGITDEDESVEKEILIKDTNTGKKAPLIFEPKKEFKEPEVKIIGKIDIDNLNKSKKAETKTEDIPTVPTAPSSSKSESEIVEKIHPEEIKEEQHPKIHEKTDLEIHTESHSEIISKEKSKETSIHSPEMNEDIPVKEEMKGYARIF